MADARALREIVDALRVLKNKADQAGSTTARSILIMTAEAIKGEAEKAERAAREGSPTDPSRRLIPGQRSNRATPPWCEHVPRW